jgi:hypothetical protein
MPSIFRRANGSFAMNHATQYPSPRRFRDLWLGLAAAAVLLWSIASLRAEPPAPSDAQPGDKIEIGPTLAPAADAAAETTPQPTLAPADAAAGEPSADGVEVLTRGPVHEAFAETVSFNPEPGIVIPKAPPEAIEELPPDQKPEGENVVWIPGYWAWDDEQSDFLWVSGIWRAIPPGRKWVSGYWREAQGGQQWVSGYWGDAAVEQVEYLPNPPATLEVGPNSAAPSADHVWVPGTWVYRTRYVWQPGYWIVPQPNWVWVPSYYAWTPGGFVFAGGYWDYIVPHRGVLFAPVYFTAGVYARPGFYYSPATAINLTIFSDHLFCRPRYGHYYFGDFYASSYVSIGIYPWFSFTKYKGYDPIWAHHRWHHRHDHDFVRHVEADYRHRRDHKEARPPHTFDEAKTVASRSRAGGDKDAEIAHSFHQMARGKDTSTRFQTLDKESREKLASNAKEFQRFRQERSSIESQANATVSKRPVKASLPKAPIASRTTDRDGPGDTPPSKPGVSRPDVAERTGDKDRGDNRSPRKRGTVAEDLTSGKPSEPAAPGRFGPRVPRDAAQAPKTDLPDTKTSDGAKGTKPGVAEGIPEVKPSQRQLPGASGLPSRQGEPRDRGPDPQDAKHRRQLDLPRSSLPEDSPAPRGKFSPQRPQGLQAPSERSAPRSLDEGTMQPKRSESVSRSAREPVPAGKERPQFDFQRRTSRPQGQFDTAPSAPKLTQPDQSGPRSRVSQSPQRSFSRSAPPQQDRKPRKRDKD